MTELIPGNLYTYRNPNAPLWDGTTVRYVGEIVPPFGRSDADIVRVDTGASGICPSDLLHELEEPAPAELDPRDVALDEIAITVRGFDYPAGDLAEIRAILARVGR